MTKLKKYQHEKPKHKIQDGRWVLFTLGEFVHVLIDEGDDPVVLVRVVEDIDVGMDDAWARQYAIIKLPQGGVVSFLNAAGLVDDDETLVQPEVLELIKRGCVK